MSAVFLTSSVSVVFLTSCVSAIFLTRYVAAVFLTSCVAAVFFTSCVSVVFLTSYMAVFDEPKLSFQTTGNWQFIELKWTMKYLNVLGQINYIFKVPLAPMGVPNPGFVHA